MDSETKKAFAGFVVFFVLLCGIFLMFVYTLLSLFPQALM